MNKEFDKFWNKQRKNHPDEPEYISMCKILEGSGEESAIIYELFDEYIPKDSFTPSEREIMVSYLIEKAEDCYDC
jgi:hypothetical protein